MAGTPGEFELIERILGRFHNGADSLVVPPGDDCAGIRTDASSLLLITTDLLVENVHFTLATITPQELGWKSMAVNISDIAAMGGRPEYGFLSIAIPGYFTTGMIDDFSLGMAECCQASHMTLAGGDTTASPSGLFVNICVIGRVNPQQCLTRGGALAGDCIQVSGHLGSSAAGLEELLSGKGREAINRELIRAHLCPQPRVETGLALSRIPGVHSMIDISDGLVQDLGHICRKSGVGAVVNADSIPIHPEVVRITGDDRDRYLNMALSGGEDYELCWTVSEENELLALRIASEAGAPAPATIGRIIPGSGVRVMDRGQVRHLTRTGFDHFKR
ncbi:MAG TPA: thiamine-phosphate kinase [bacterium]|nr:thiamine-phosphate kinase [bacterium]